LVLAGPARKFNRIAPRVPRVAVPPAEVFLQEEISG
jgi:hypothetical protein